MIGRALIVAGLLALAGSAGAAPRKATAVPARPDWARTIVRLPDGAYRLGNPAAKVKLVEYLSMTCPHCGHFATEGLPELRRDYIAKGLVSIEFKHAIRDGFDMAASLLVRCGGAQRYLGDVDAVFRAQSDWIGHAEGFQPDPSLPVAALPGAFAKAAGLDTMMTARGLPAARGAACLADTAEQQRLVAMRTEAFETRKIAGTPGFVLNGNVVNAFGWDTLKPLIDAALR